VAGKKGKAVTSKTDKKVTGKSAKRMGRNEKHD
jgi:hypothetical protein